MSQRDVPLTVDAGDILPIIKRFMYAEREIFLRELISNSIDALAKLSKIARTDSDFADDGDPLRVEVSLDSVRATVTIADNGIGMSRDEVIRYINQIAVSGAREFVERHGEGEDQLIGRFGLGFYSSFMVSKRVEIETLSWRPGAGGCHWSCDGGRDTRIDDESPRTQRGTRVICHLNKEEREFLDAERVEEVVRRFLDYAPYPVFVEGRQVNVVTAPWHLSPAERDGLSRESYWTFYERLNPNENRPLAWFHVDSDHPIQVRALLFVPDCSGREDGNVRMFANRTFITDHCSELLPDWLQFLDGVVDCAELPLNVARERFQQDRKITQLRQYLATKATDFLSDLLVQRRADYIRFWERYGIHVKRGYLEAAMAGRSRQTDQIERLLGFASSRRALTTLADYLARAPKTNKPTLLYATDVEAQRSHIELLQGRNLEVLYCTNRVDAVLVRALDQAHTDWSFARVDQVGAVDPRKPTPDTLRDQAATIRYDVLTDLLGEIAGERVEKVSVEALSSREIPAVLRMTEAGTLTDDMRRAIGAKGLDEPKWSLVINENCPLIQILGRFGARLREAEIATALVGQIWDQVRLSSGLLEKDPLADAIRRNRDFLTLVAMKLIPSPHDESTP